MRIVIATLSIIFALCVIVVSLINYAERVTVRLWPEASAYTYPDTPVSWVIFFSALAGFVFAGVIAILEGSKTRLSNARLRSQIRRLQQEMVTLKRWPPAPPGTEPPVPEPLPEESDSAEP